MTQEDALTILKTGSNAFLTGEPGTGKSYIIAQFVDWLKEKGISFAVTASTGISAVAINGRTIHSWSGIGIKKFLTSSDIQSIVHNENINERIKETDVLIIDEISMLEGAVIDCIDIVCRNIKEAPDLPFGGIQIVFVGDFFQLPPVSKQGEDVIYAFSSTSWQKAECVILYLTEQYRQNDTTLSTILQSIRAGSIDTTHLEILKEQTDIGYKGVDATILYTNNVDVDSENEKRLSLLSGEEHLFSMSSTGNAPLVETLKKNCISPEKLLLKKGALVMFTKNNLQDRYVNGTLGVIDRFEDGNPVVVTHDGNEIDVIPVVWSVTENGEDIATITQLPLRLAWAITIHKSQGTSLDAAQIDLSRAFVEGQGYVALSRVKTLKGVKLMGLNDIALRVSSIVQEKDKEYRTLSAQADVFLQENRKEVERLQEAFIQRVGRHIEKKDTRSTIEKTQELLLEKETLKEIAKKRDVKESTIMGHLLTLAQKKMISKNDMRHILPQRFKSSYPHIERAIIEVGACEKLRALYEHLDEAYSYDEIRLACAWYSANE